VKIAVGMYQNQGGREYQQDAMAIKQFGSLGVLAILADGMGGYEGGEIASRLASEKMREFTIEGEDVGASLRKSLDRANESIRAYKQEHPEVQSMGTTLIGCFMTDSSCQWVSVGDSPLLLIRDRSQIERINANHSVAGLLDLQVRNGEISAEEAQSSPQRHMLTSAVSGEEIPNVDLSTPFRLRRDDLLILASDGVETLDPQRILEIVRTHVPVTTQENVQHAAEALVREVIAAGKPNQDNVTVIILGYLEEQEPQTRFYRPAEEKKPWLWIGLGGALLAILLLAWSFWGGGKSDQGVHPAPATSVTPAQPAPSREHRQDQPQHKQAEKPEGKTPAAVKKGENRTAADSADKKASKPGKSRKAEQPKAKTEPEKPGAAKQGGYGADTGTQKSVSPKSAAAGVKEKEPAGEGASKAAKKIHIEIKDKKQ